VAYASSCPSPDRALRKRPSGPTLGQRGTGRPAGNRDEQRLFVAIGLSINFGHTTVMQDWPVTAVNYQAAIASTLGVSAAAAAVIAAQYPLSAFPSPPLLGELRRAGFPSSADQPWWPAFGSHSQQMISLVPPRPQVETNFAAEHHCAFWAHAG